MMPTLKNGRLVLGVKRKNYIIGDIIVARHGGGEVVKRIANITDGIVYLKGDNRENSHDAEVQITEIIAKIVL